MPLPHGVITLLPGYRVRILADGSLIGSLKFFNWSGADEAPIKASSCIVLTSCVATLATHLPYEPTGGFCTPQRRGLLSRDGHLIDKCALHPCGDAALHSSARLTDPSLR
jgi:hypothetical protein